MKTDFLSSLNGLYVLTQKGELGFYDDEQQFHLDVALSEALREHNVNLLDGYRADSGRQARVGIIYPTRDAHPWKTPTFFFDEHTIRHLYPVGTINAALTTFQKKNQCNSYYRAVE